ncbi:MAG: DnaJ domain-containing protein [Holophagaceae bacterium]|nr:DnaJ domain-containing protein [Holophagaceae bacterium]
MNPFEILELLPGASMEEIKAAYHRLAKQWHPDRFSGDQKAAAEDRFRLLSESFNALKDPDKRRAFEDQFGKQTTASAAPEPKRTAIPERTADDWFGEAKDSLTHGDLERAMGLIQYAIRLDAGKPPFHVLMADIIEKTTGNRRAMIRSLETAAKLEPKNVDTQLRLADLFRAEGMQARAERLLQSARALAPHHKYFKAEAKAAAAEAKATAAASGLKDRIQALWGKVAKKG